MEALLVPRNNIQVRRGMQSMSQHYFRLTHGVRFGLPSIDITEIPRYSALPRQFNIGASQPNDVVLGRGVRHVLPPTFRSLRTCAR